MEKERKEKFFFFKQKTAYEIKECDWSSDVCSSDLDSILKEIDVLKQSIQGLESRLKQLH